MRSSSFLPCAAALLIVLARGVLGSDSKHPAPAPSQSDLAALKDSIAALGTGPIHDLNDSALKTGTRLDVLEREIKRISLGLDGADWSKWARDQASTQTAVGDLVGKSDALDQQMQELGTRLDAAAAEAVRTDKELKAALNLSANQLLALTQEERQSRELWPKQFAAEVQAVAGRQRESLDETRFEGEVALGGVVILILGALALYSRGGRRRQRELSQSITRLQTELRQSLAAAGAARTQPSGANWEAIESRLYQLAQRWESAAFANDPLTVQSSYRGRAAAPLPTLSPSEKPTISVGALPEPTVASRLLWPAEFLDPESPLSRWRFLLESHFDDAEHPALPVLSGLLGLRTAAERPCVTAAEIASAAFRLSEALHAYWQSLADLSADDRLQASAAWIRSVRELVAHAAPRLELREVMPGSRVDPDLMHATEERSGNHLNVAEVHSWAVVDRSGDRPKVLFRAQIAST